MDGFDAEQQELIRSLLKKRDELMRMQEAIHRLQAMDVPRLEPASAPEEPEEEEEYEEEEEAEEEEEEEEEDSNNPVRPRPLVLLQGPDPCPAWPCNLAWAMAPWRAPTLDPSHLRTLPPRTPPSFPSYRAREVRSRLACRRKTFWRS
jgi:hypothetical protein